MTLERNTSRSYSAGITRVAALVTLGTFGLCCSGVAVGQSAMQKAESAQHRSTSSSFPAPQPGQQTFSSAAQASQALVAAVKNDDEESLLKILGANSKTIVSSGDEAEDKDDRAQFAQKYQQMHRLVTEPDGTTTLYIGAENWPTPIPLVHRGSSWYFDTAAGKQEILYRRVGKNEISAIQACGELVDAEKEYHGQLHDGDSTPQYAQKLFSDPGKQNGLYWQTSSGEAASPIGPMFASASYSSTMNQAQASPQPFEGYYFHILKGEKASGTARDYIVDGKMTRGFAFVAYPAQYRSSGVMTFIVDQDGIVYEKDLGPKTDQLARKMTLYDRDSSWRKAD